MKKPDRPQSDTPTPSPQRFVGLLSCEDLLLATGFERIGDMRRALDQAGIRYFLGRAGRPWTTMDLLNAAGGLVPTSGQNDGVIRPEDFFL